MGEPALAVFLNCHSTLLRTICHSDTDTIVLWLTGARVDLIGVEVKKNHEKMFRLLF